MYDLIGKMTQNERAHLRLHRVLRFVPDGLLEALLRGAGHGLYRLMGKKARARIESNMLDMLGKEHGATVKNWTRSYMVNIAVTLFELLVGVYSLPELKDKGRIDRRFTVEGERRLGEALRAGKGAIVFAPHIGNFFYAYWFLSQYYQCLTVATAQSPELRPIYLKFQDIGCRGLDYDETPPLEIIRTLRKHLAVGGVVFLLGDFYRSTFPQAEWFGRLTRSPEGAASLSIDQQAPIVPFYTYRERRFRHRLVFGMPLVLHERYGRHERTTATNELNLQLEHMVRSVPSQWFYWFNTEERWKQTEGKVGEPAGDHAQPIDSANAAG